MNYPSLSLEQKQIENAFQDPRNHQKTSLKQQRGYFQGTKNIPLRSNFYLNQTTKCEQCDYKTSKYDLMYSHVRVKHSDLKIKCTECNFSHPFPTKVNTHYKQVHLGEKRHHRRYICRNEFCQSFSTQNCAELETHSLLFCKICKFSSDRSDDFKFHIQSVHEGIVYPCEHCSSYVAKRKLNLTRHILARHPEISKPETFSCTDEGCNFETRHKRTLKSHVESKHEGFVRYKCDFMNCDYGTNESKSIKEHSFLHNGCTPHKCDLCDKMFTRLRQLKKHKKKQHIKTGEAKIEKNKEFELPFQGNDTVEPKLEVKNLEKEQKSPEPEEKAVTSSMEPEKAGFRCLCAVPGCDFMSEEGLQEKQIREHFYFAHSDMQFASDSFIWLNSDMAVLLGIDVRW